MVPTMVLKSSLSYLLLAVSVFDVGSVTVSKVDKNPWKPIISRAGKNARQYHGSVYGDPSSPNYSQSYSGPHVPMMARPVTYVPPAVTFNPPQMVYGNPSITKAVSSPSAPYRHVTFPPSPRHNYPISQMTPSYAAPAPSYQYQLVTDQPTMSHYPTMPMNTMNTVTYQFVPKSSVSTPKPESMQYQLLAEASSQSIAKSYSPSQPSVQFQLVHEPLMDAPPAPNTSISQFLTTPTPSLTPTTQSPPTVSASIHTTANDNASFVDVVTVLSKYFRATGTQLGEMFTQLSENTELNSWRPWTTPTTSTTTPAPPTAQPSQLSPIVIPMMYPVMMPAPQTQPSPPQPHPPVYIPPPPLTVYSAQPSVSVPYLQSSFSQPQPAFIHPPPTYFQHPQSYVQNMPIKHSHSFSRVPPAVPHPPSSYPDFPDGKSINEILDNSIDHDYYYDCDK